MFKCLELFSGTHSFGKVAEEIGYSVLSLDLILSADIKEDILTWDYKKYPKNSFDIIWASPPCTFYSRLQNTWIGRKRKDGTLVTKEWIEVQRKESDLIMKKTLEIIDYFNPFLWFIENPVSCLKDREIMKNIPYYTCDYCMYCDWGYRKRTNIWTNKEDWTPLICNKDCGNMFIHKTNLGNDIRKKHKADVSKNFGGGTNRLDRYRMPPNLIFSLLQE
tara:strand:+ start:67 stop:723 length:657 start_codon:yes stop_codon:yes gene_type:complete